MNTRHVFPAAWVSAGIKVEHQPLLSSYTTFRLGGPVETLIHCSTAAALISVVAELSQRHLDFVLLGGGSNVLVSDDGLDCVVVRFACEAPEIRQEGSDLFVSAATAWDDLVFFSVECGLEGLSVMSGIPGTVGGAVVGNAGAFGRQIGDYLKAVTLLKRDGAVYERKPEELGLGYRHSFLKESDNIVLACRVGLTYGSRDKLRRERQATLALRREKHPDLHDHPCAGSFFRNVEPTSKAERRQAAGFFLEQAGGKHLCVGGARIFEKHANIIIKGDGCRAQDVYDLSLKMQALVKEKFQIDLVREVRLLGTFRGQPDHGKRLLW